jgi:hypothetical protein
MHVPFFLDDNTGKVMVDPRGAELDLHRDFQQEFCDSFLHYQTRSAVQCARLFSMRHGVNTTNKIKVEEFCIKPKNALFLLGTLGENPGLELTPQPIQDDEHNTLTFGKVALVQPSTIRLGRKRYFRSQRDPPTKLRSSSAQSASSSSAPVPFTNQTLSTQTSGTVRFARAQRSPLPHRKIQPPPDPSPTKNDRRRRSSRKSLTP